MPRIFIIAISLSLALVLGIIFLWPKYQNLQIIQIQLENKEVEFNNLNEYQQDLSSLSGRLEEFKEPLAKIDTALPENSSLSLISLYDYFKKTSSENGLILSNIGSSSSPPDKGNINVIPLSVEVNGSYSSFQNFLKTLEKSARIIEVDNISFSVPEEGALFSFKLTIKTHSY